MTGLEEETFPIPGIPDFWHELRRAGRRFLVLDYDGTLAPFHPDRMRAFPLEGIPECLSVIARSRDTTLAIVSGRPVREILELVGDLGVTLVGSHGWEIRNPEGSYRAASPSPEQERGLRQAEQELSERGLGPRVERKVASLAIHTRGMPVARAESLEDELLRAWSKDAPDHGLECRRFNGGVELRSTGLDKGTILCDLMRGQPGDTLWVYVGDDETDEDAFIEVRERGWGIKVGTRDAATQARGRLSDCRAVLEFLRGWIHVTDVERG